VDGQRHVQVAPKFLGALPSRIKAGLGKLNVDINPLIHGIEASGFLELPVRATHAAAVRDLPNIHRDPFDRIFFAQAVVEPLQFMTADRNLGAYSNLIIVV
jgi:PIN domain nuclease of toxin-antitoxin system